MTIFLLKVSIARPALRELHLPPACGTPPPLAYPYPMCTLCLGAGNGGRGPWSRPYWSLSTLMAATQALLRWWTWRRPQGCIAIGVLTRYGSQPLQLCQSVWSVARPLSNVTRPFWGVLTALTALARATAGVDYTIIVLYRCPRALFLFYVMILDHGIG